VVYNIAMETCGNCGRKLIIKQTKRTAAQLKKPYYYTAYYFCPHCNKLYHDEKFKVVNGQLALGEQQLEKKIVSASDQEPTANRQEPFSVHIWTDGACTNNGYPNAKAAWAFVSDETERAGLVEGRQTNNVAEGLAILYALKWAAENGYKKIKLHTDSQISINNLRKPAYQVKMNREIFEEIEEVIAKNGLKVYYQKVLGHSGDVNNERADKLANGLAVKKD
jgi:ribonuclease HI